MLAKSSLAIFVLAAILFAFAGIAGYMTSGILRESNSIYIFALAIAVCFGVSWLAAAALLIASCVSFFRNNRSKGLIFLGAALLLVFIPFLCRPLGIYTGTLAEQADIKRYGLNHLRTEVADLIRYSRDKDYPSRWFGYEVPAEDLPAAIAALAQKAAYVTISDSGATIVTDGMGSWRGGYLIQPTEITHAPEGARTVADGVYYVIAK